MARKTKAEQAAAISREHKRASRERQKEAGLVEVHLDPEVSTVRLLEKAASLSGKSVSQIVVELVKATPPSSLLTTPKWSSPDCPARDLKLTIPEAVRDALASVPRLSAGSVLEWLVLEHCKVITTDIVEGGEPDDDGQVATRDDVKYRTLFYDHPTEDGPILKTWMRHVEGGLKTANGQPFGKYEHRLQIRTEALKRLRAAQGKPWDESDAYATLQAAAVDRAVERVLGAAWGAHDEAVDARRREVKLAAEGQAWTPAAATARARAYRDAQGDGQDEDGGDS